jgi:hypothetical protein
LRLSVRAVPDLGVPDLHGLKGSLSQAISTSAGHECDNPTEITWHAHSTTAPAVS